MAQVLRGDARYLHTNSFYAPIGKNLVEDKYSQTDLERQCLDAYLILREKEQDFYRRFGYDSADAFYHGIRDIMHSSERDLEILRNLSSTNLRQSLKRYSENALAIFGDKNIIISLRMEKNFDLGKELGKVIQEILSSGGTYVKEGDRLNVGMKWDTSMVKRLVNAAQKKQFRKGSPDINTLLKYIRDNVTDAIQIYEGVDVKNPTEILELRSGPFNYSTEEIQSGDKQQLIEIRRKILNFLFQDLGITHGSNDFKDAVFSVLERTIGQELSDISFFVGGANSWINNVVGAMGEFQAAIFFNYITKKCPNKNLSKEITEIIGNQTNNYSQKFHSDLQILEAFGIQVKNYGSTMLKGQEREIEVRLHPQEIAPLMRDQELVSFVINSFFNVSLVPYSEEEWDEFFKRYATELLNLELPTTVTIPSKVSFYLIGGHLIPGSEIISRAFLNQKEGEMIKVRHSISKTTGYSDLGYLSKDSEGKPRFLQWWQGYSDHWKPTDDNTLDAWDKKISIRTYFTYTPFWEMDFFKIF